MKTPADWSDEPVAGAGTIEAPDLIVARYSPLGLACCSVPVHRVHLVGHDRLSRVEADESALEFMSVYCYGNASATHSPGCRSDPIGSTMYCLPSCR